MSIDWNAPVGYAHAARLIAELAEMDAERTTADWINAYAPEPKSTRATWDADLTRFEANLEMRTA